MSEREIRVLLVEDEEADALLVSAMLRDVRGGRYAVTRVAGLAPAIRCMRASERPDIVLLDLSLPDSKGLDTFTALHQADPEVPIIVLTGTDDEQVATAAVHNGAQDYLIKGRIDATLLAHAICYGIERNRLRNQLKFQNEQLERRVAERTAELSGANADLRAAVKRLEAHDRAKSDFVSNVSHELRTPLSSMGFAIDNLLNGALGPVSDAVREYLVMLQGDCRRLNNTIADILDLSRMDADAFVLNRARVPLPGLVRGVVESLRIQAESKRVALTYHAAGGAFAFCDRVKMERAVTNLVHNAVKYTGEGGHVEVALRVLSNDGCTIHVVDDGIGIPAEHIGRITERYYRVGEHVDGTGLGLNLCKEIVERHGGELHLASPPPGRERGTAAWVRIPTCAAPRVLVVDDDEDVRLAMRRELTGEGFDAAVCGSAAEALALISVAPPEILIVDLILPGMDGLELISRVRADRSIRTPGMVAITGGELPESKRRVLDQLAVPIVLKPCNPRNLTRCIECVAGLLLPVTDSARA